MLSKQEIDTMTNEQFVKILKEKLQDTEKKIKDAEKKIDLYKDWHLGSPMQQRTRKKSFDKNTEKLVVLENRLNIINTELSELEVSKCV